MSYIAYIVECSDGSLYSGITTDIDRRVREHNSTDKGARYTKTRRPVRLRYTEIFPTRSDAQKREYALKTLTRLEKLALVARIAKPAKSIRKTQENLKK